MMQDAKTNEEIISRLSKLCEEWGGSLVEVESVEYRFKAPFDSGVGACYSKKQIFYVRDVDPSFIIHEMGHVFACLDKPISSDEFEFFGWEWEVAKQVGVSQEAWFDSNDSYGVGVGEHGSTEFYSLSLKDKLKLLKERKNRAIDKGLIVNGKPVAIR